jgi:predicted RNA binding protein YcfA (HicA-like mRNA interferase family)
MPKLPVVSGRDVVKALARIGYEVDHQKGSHVTLRRVEYPYRRITVPMHREIAKGTLKAILNEVGLTVEEFLELL